MPHATRRVDRATHALTAYELDAFPGKPSLLKRDAFYTEALLAALICDLEHYTHHHDIDFSAVLKAGHAINTQEVAQDTHYKVGDQARLPRQDDRCGTVIGWQTTAPDAEPYFLIAVPGIPYIYAESAAHLAPAPGFPPIQTTLGTVHHADQAEQLYISITTHLPNAPDSTRQTLEHDRQRLLAALSSWSGISETRLHNELAPRPPTPNRQPTNTKPPTADSSIAINQSLPGATPHPHDHRNQQPPSPDPTPAA
ncbi:hypothetical protein OHR68_29695 [Spirillospora sp. NBC_00431]